MSSLHRSSRHRSFVVLAVVWALFVAGCSSSGSGTDAGPTSVPATSAPTTPSTTAASGNSASNTSSGDTTADSAPSGPSGPSGSEASSAPAIPDGHSERTIEVGGLERTYLLYRPSGLTDPAPLVVMMHGGFGSAEQAERSYGWDAEADSGRFIVAYPDGLGRAWNAGGGCCGRSAREDIDDVGFVSDVVDQLVDSGDVDPQKVFATGMSNGAIMSYRLACETTLFAAIAPVAGTQLVDCANPSPTSVLHIHGLADGSVHFDGTRGGGVAKIDGPPIPEVIASWRKIDACGAPIRSDDGAVRTSTAQCAGGRTVELITIAGAGHQWPGSEQIRAQADPPSTALNATSTIWEFFSAHHR